MEQFFKHSAGANRSRGCVEMSRDFHRRLWWQDVMLAMIVLLIVAPCDIPIARLCYGNPPPHAIVKLLEIIASTAGGGLGVLLLLVAVVVFDRTKLSRLPLLVSSSLGAGLLAHIIKLCVFRARPCALDLSTATFNATFHDLFPFFSAGNVGQSFPSGHTATAFGLAMALGMTYPRRGWIFIVLAVSVAVSRVITHAHFPTDVAAGAMLGAAWARTCHCGFVAPAIVWFERMIEHTIARRKDVDLTISTSRCEPEEPTRSAWKA
jgi:membrane-associated phospholipid phosphatase